MAVRCTSAGFETALYLKIYRDAKAKVSVRNLFLDRIRQSRKSNSGQEPSLQYTLEKADDTMYRFHGLSKAIS